MVNRRTTFEIFFPIYGAALAVHMETLPVEAKGRFDEGLVASSRPDHYLGNRGRPGRGFRWTVINLRGLKSLAG